MSGTIASGPVTTTIEDGVAVIRLDDGKVNVVSHAVLAALHEGLDQALEAATAVAIIGREGKLSAGFDLTEMQAGLENTQRLVGAGGKLMMRLYGHPQPTVIAVTGHALAAGALITLSCDLRIAGDGPAKIGLNETAIGMGLPIFALELAKARLATSHLGRSTIQAEIYDPAGALAAGYVDRVVPAADVERIAIEEARRLGQLPNSAYKFTKLALRRSMIDHVLDTIDDDMINMTTPH